MEEENKLAESAVEKEELEQTQAESNDSNEQKEPVEEKTEETEEPSNETEVKNEENEENEKSDANIESENDDNFEISDIYEEESDGIIDKLFHTTHIENEVEQPIENEHKVDPDEYALYKKYL